MAALSTAIALMVATVALPATPAVAKEANFGHASAAHAKADASHGGQGTYAVIHGPHGLGETGTK
jgi:hypothetical protein